MSEKRRDSKNRILRTGESQEAESEFRQLGMKEEDRTVIKMA